MCMLINSNIYSGKMHFVKLTAMYALLAPCITLLLFFPFLGFIVSSVLVYILKVKELVLKCYLTFAAIFISLVASIRFPVKDLAHYIDDFHEYGSYSFISFYDSVYKDHLFYYVSKLLFELGLTSDQGFTFFWAFVFYGLIIRSLYLFFKNNFLDKQQLIIVVLFLILSVEYLVLSTHLMRQFAASALLVYFVTSVMIQRRSSMSLVGVGFLHFSTFVFVLMYPILKNKLTIRSFLVLGVFGFLIFGINLEAIGVFSLLGVPTLDLIINRVLEAGIVGTDNGDVSLKMYFISSIFLMVMFYLIYFQNRYKYILIFNYMLFSFLIVIFTSDIPLLTLRFSFYQYPFYVLALAIVAKEFLIDVVVKFVVFCAMVLYSLRLYLYFENNLWITDRYIDQVLFKNVFFYLGAL